MKTRSVIQGETYSVHQDDDDDVDKGDQGNNDQPPPDNDNDDNNDDDAPPAGRNANQNDEPTDLSRALIVYQPPTHVLADAINDSVVDLTPLQTLLYI